MNRPLPQLLASLLFLAAACHSPTDLEPTDSCAGEQSGSHPTFEDPALEASVKAALGVASDVELTCFMVGYLSDLDASDAGVTSLVGIQNLVNLRSLDLGGSSLDDLSPLSGLQILYSLFMPSSGISSLDGLANLPALAYLDLSDNAIADIAAVSGMGDLEFLDLTGNQIMDVTAVSGLVHLRFLYLGDNFVGDIDPLSGLTSLGTLYLDANEVTDLAALAGLPALMTVDLHDNIALSEIQPLVDNGDLGTGDLVNLRGTAVDCPSVNALRAKGVTVDSGCPAT